MRLLTTLTYVDAINQRRRVVIEGIAGRLNETANSYIVGSAGCNEFCRSLQIGILVMKMRELGLKFSPGVGLERSYSTDSFNTMSLEKALLCVEQIRVPTWSGKSDSDHHQCRTPESYLSNCAKVIANDVRKYLVGLKLDDHLAHQRGRTTTMTPPDSDLST